MGCPYFKDEICNVRKESPPSQFPEKFCNQEEVIYSNCPFYLAKEAKSGKIFDLRNIPSSHYDGLKKLDISKIINAIIRQMVPSLTKCKGCKSHEKRDQSKSNLCKFHSFLVQKITYILQQMNGFNSKTPAAFTPLPEGPFSNEVDRILGNEDVSKKWLESKIDTLELSDNENNLLSSLIKRYYRMGSKNLELLTTFHSQYPEEKKPFDLMNDIKDHYENSEEFIKESDIFKDPLFDTLKKFEHTFEPVKALGVGSSGITIKLKDKHLGHGGTGIFRVLKFPRPRGNDFRISNLNIIKKEIDLLCSLNHDRIVKVILAGETPYRDLQLPWFIMEFIGSSKNLRQYLEDEEATKLQNLQNLIHIVTDISSAIQYLHQKEIVHCDIKADNILIKMEERPIAMLTDLGYARAKKEGDPDELITVRFDHVNAHPFLKNKISRTSDPAAFTAKIKRKELDVRFDLYALGLTIQNILSTIEKRRLENNKILNVFDDKNYESKYLKLTMCRLISSGALPPVNHNPNDLPSLEKHFRGLNNENFLELAYDNSDDLLEDLYKLNNISLESWIPELNPSAKDVITLGAKETRVVLTERLTKILEHMDFDRLGSITQLGLITYVYPSAKHTRLEHSLGTYGQTCEYIRALWYNTHDPLFKSIMRKQDLCTIMLAALLHDLGYYPLAHDLEDCREWRESEIRHEEYAATMIKEKLADIIEKEWDKTTRESITRIIFGNINSFKEKILRSIISGPIDADKLDYLLRDSMHLGVPYAEGIDKQWFLRNLTIAYEPGIRPSIAITEKGRVTAESIAMVRFYMFSVAYWHHTIRAVKAMLKYAITRLDTTKNFNKKQHYDWFQEIPYGNADFEKISNVKKVIEYTDFLQLCWIRDKLDNEGKSVIDLILTRDLFKRIIVLDKNMPESSSIYDNLVDADDEDIEHMRIKLEKKLRKHLVDEGFKDVANLNPLVLIDVPKIKNENNELYVVSELGCRPISQNSIIWKQLVEQLSKSLGKVRFFVHPTIAPIIKQIFPPKELLALISQVVEGPDSYRRK